MPLAMPTQLYAMDGMKVTEEAVVDEYKKQVAARSLYQVKPKNPYFFWSVISLVFQAMEGRPGWAAPCTSRSPMMAADGKMEHKQEVLLYLLVLELPKGLEQRAQRHRDAAGPGSTAGGSGSTTGTLIPWSPGTRRISSPRPRRRASVTPARWMQNMAMRGRRSRLRLGHKL